MSENVRTPWQGANRRTVIVYAWLLLSAEAVLAQRELGPVTS